MSLISKAKSVGIAAAIMLATALPAFAASAYATSNVNVRSCDSTSCRVVDVLRRGERVEIDYCRGSWCAIERRGADGWVNASYLSRGGDRYDRYDRYDRDDYYFGGGFYIRPPRDYPRRIIRRVEPSVPTISPYARFGD